MRKKNPIAVAGGKKGGPARAKKLTAAQLSAIGRLGAKVRWKKKRKMVHGGEVAPGKAVAEYKTGSRVESGRVEIGLPSPTTARSRPGVNPVTRKPQRSRVGNPAHAPKDT